MTIGERIQKRRTALGMTQEDLALALGYKSRSSINKIEKDERSLTRDLHNAKSAVDDLLNAENAEKPPESGNVHNLEAVFVGISVERTTGPSNRTPAAHPSGGKQYERLSASAYGKPESV